LVAKKELKKQKASEELKRLNEKKVELIKPENIVIEHKASEKTVEEIVKEMSERRQLQEIELHEKEFGKGGIADLIRPV
jgi:hypothetical protein